MATKTKPTKGHGRKPSRNGKAKKKQGYLPGMEPPSIPKIDNLADKYRDIRNERMELTKQEVAAADLLDAAMREHGLTTYEYRDYVVRINRTEKVSVKKKTTDQQYADAVAAAEAEEK